MVTNYTLDGTNMKRTSYGIGQSMNLYDDGTDFHLYMNFQSDSNLGEYLYATYQHATTNVSLATSKSYSF